MRLENVLEEGQSYASPTEFLEQVEDQLPEDQTYWLENSTGINQTFEELEELKNYLDSLEEDWEKYRDFISLDADSDLIEQRESNQTEYLDVEFPYISLETEYSSASAGKAGSINFGFVREKDQIKQPVSRVTGD